MELISLCGRQSTPVAVGSPVPDSSVVFKTDSTVSDLGFNLTFSYSDCGGVLAGPSHVGVRPPGAGSSAGYDNGVDCAWSLNFQEGTQIKVQIQSIHFQFRIFCTFMFFSNFNELKVTFTEFALETSSGCSKDYVSVHNGGSPSSPVIWKGCGDSVPSSNPIISMSNK